MSVTGAASTSTLTRPGIGHKMARSSRQGALSDYQFEIDKEDLADRIYEAIEGLIGDDSIRDVCKETGLSVGVVTRLIDRKHQNRWPSVLILEKLAKAYDAELVISFE